MNSCLNLHQKLFSVGTRENAFQSSEELRKHR